MNCTVEEKDNGEGICIPFDASCALGYESVDPMNTDNCDACSELFKNNGAGVCVLFL